MGKCIVINRVPFGEEGKLRKKHLEQVEAFQNMGFDTYFVGFDQNKCYLMHNGECEYVCRSPLHGYRSYLAMFQAVRIACKKYGPFDLAYMRMIPANPALLHFLADIRNSCKKIVYEIPTFPYDDEKNLREIHLLYWCAQWLDRRCRNYLKKYIDLAIVLTSQVETVFGIPAIVLRNGINVSGYKLRNLQNTDKTEILCMGKLQRWHGYDRMIAGTINYKNTHAHVPFQIHILGDGDARPMLMRQAEAGGLDNTIIDFPGIVVGDQLDEYFDRCTFAVESLGLHRAHLGHSSTLKSREYIARGTPFVYSLAIPGVDESCDFCCKVPTDETAIDMGALLQWAAALPDDCGERMREYAIRHFRWETQFEEMLKALEA